jgi:1-acyl-sn-glycerol-3-phosphate acyltransferase
VLPVGVAGAYEAWPIRQRFPRFAPLFLPAGTGTIGIVIGKPIPSEQLVQLPPEKMLQEMQRILVDLSTEAERIRRKS